MKKKIVALLPMKANSERVKGKNFKLLAGKPLFKWILDTLLLVEEIDLVVINTDAREILLDNGIEENSRVLILDRKPKLQGDLVSMNLILEDDIDNISADLYLMTHTTNPLLSKETIKLAINSLINNNNADSLFTVNKIQSRFYREDMSAVNHDPAELVRTQDLEPWYEENSSLYLFTYDSFKKNNSRIGEKPIMHLTSSFESVDIDEQEDWVIAEALAMYQQRKS